MPNSKIKIDLDWIEELEVQQDAEDLEMSKADRELRMPLMLVESLGSWDAAEVIGVFDRLPDELVDHIWELVPLSRGGGARSLSAEITWNEMINDWTHHDAGVLTRLREKIDEIRRQNNGTAG
ncbi:MAG: hypothetical protein AAGC44_15885 [Planctomycetota bacterium]